MIILPKKETYDCPEGMFRAVLREVILLDKSDKGRVEHILRLVFVITSLPHPRLVYLAGKNYSLSQARKLGHDLDSWLGGELDKLITPEGKLAIEKIEGLKGRGADLEIVHLENDGYESAYRHIVKITPPGTLIQMDERVAA